MKQGLKSSDGHVCLKPREGHGPSQAKGRLCLPQVYSEGHGLSVSSGSEKVLAKPLAKLKYHWPNLKSIGQI